jgi:hypothetical protein
MVFPMRSMARSCLILIAGAAHAQAASAAWPRQFDLVCNARGHVAADPHPRSRGTYPANLRVWRDPFRLIVDLGRMRFCTDARCVDWGASRIVSANARQILLAYIPRPGQIENAVTETVRYRDGYYRYRQESDDGYLILETGVCRRARFSGFPAGTRPAESMNYRARQGEGRQDRQDR